MSDDPKMPARDRLLSAGAELFAKGGFAGTSVRDICRLAGTGSNMIHHYFGSKQGLFQAIIEGISEDVFFVPMRLIEDPATSAEDFSARFGLFISETLHALIAHANPFRVVVGDLMVLDAFGPYNERLVGFLDDAKARGWVRADFDSAMMTGIVIDRLGNQILYAPAIATMEGYDITSSTDYRKRWLKANIDFMLAGMLAR